MIRYRWAVLAVWLVVLFGGGYREHQARAAPRQHVQGARNRLRARADGPVQRLRRPQRRQLHRRLPGRRTPQTRRSERPAGAHRRAPRTSSRRGRPTALRVGGPHVLYGDVTSTLTSPTRRGTPTISAGARAAAAGVDAYVTGAAAIQPDLDPIFNADLTPRRVYRAPDRASSSCSSSSGSRGRSRSRSCLRSRRSTGRSGSSSARAPLTMATLRDEPRPADRARDLDRLLAADRLPLPRGARAAGLEDDAIVRTMATAGRAVIFSARPSRSGSRCCSSCRCPFMRSMGVGGFLIPLVSIAGRGDAAAGAALALRAARDEARARRGMLRAAALPLPHSRDADRRLLGAARALDHAPAGPLPGRRRARCCSARPSRRSRSS